MGKLLVSGERGALAQYLAEIGRQAVLTREEERQLFIRMHEGDEEARVRLIQANLRFVVKIAREYRRFDLPLSDLISEGKLGLMEALERFDAATGFRFISYAVWWIRYAMLRALADQARLVRIPANQVQRLSQIFETIRRLEQGIGHHTSSEEVAWELGISPEEIDHTLMMEGRHQSLETLLDDEKSRRLMDLLGSPMPSPEEEALDRRRREIIAESLQVLGERDAEIVRLYYGLDGGEPLSLEKIAQRFGLTRERVRQIREEALSRLRHPSRALRLRELWKD